MKYLKYCLPTLGQSWMILVLTVLGQLLASLLLMPLTLHYPDVTLITLTLPYVLTFVLPLLYMMHIGRKSMVEDEVTGRVKPAPMEHTSIGGLHPLLFLFTVTVSCYAVSIALDPFNIWMPAPEWFEKLMAGITVESDFGWSFFTVAVCAPVLEELVCRGIICRGLLTRYSSPWPAIIWSAAIFAVMHLNPWQGIPAFLLGVWFGWIYYRTGSLWTTMFLHFLNNGTVIMLGHFLPSFADLDSFSSVFPSMDLYWLAVASSIALFVISNLVLLNRFLPHRTNNIE